MLLLGRLHGEVRPVVPLPAGDFKASFRPPIGRTVPESRIGEHLKFPTGLGILIHFLIEAVEKDTRQVPLCLPQKLERFL